MVVGAAVAALMSANTPAVEQVHLALGLSSDKMNVAWVSHDATPATVFYSPVSNNATWASVQGDIRPLNVAGIRNTHVATMHGLLQGVQYEYCVGNSSSCGISTSFSGTSKRFRFWSGKRPDVAEKGGPDVHVIFGDMGASHAFSLCKV